MYVCYYYPYVYTILTETGGASAAGLGGIFDASSSVDPDEQILYGTEESKFGPFMHYWECEKLDDEGVSVGECFDDQFGGAEFTASGAPQ